MANEEGKDGSPSRPASRRAAQRIRKGVRRFHAFAFCPLLRGRGRLGEPSLPLHELDKDHSGEPSLPLTGKVRALAVGEVNERPVFGTRHQSLSHRIVQDVIGLFPTAFLAP